ncbi:MAG: PriCT-2 domain-containing protein [Methylococcales bacterium]|nr:PriCT-2 domain-containing protein [Methylococcales bacterium]
MTLASYENVESALRFISPDFEEREEWVKIGMAVKDGLNGEGFDLFDSWSKGSDSYQSHDAKDTWRSIKAGGGVTVGTLFYLAGENGWKPDTTAEPETEQQRLKREAERKARTQKEARAKTTKSKQAIAKVEKLLNTAVQASENHPYLMNKGVGVNYTFSFSIQQVSLCLHSPNYISAIQT